MMSRTVFLLMPRSRAIQRPSPARKFGNEDHVDLSSLGEFHDPVPSGSADGSARGGFPEHIDDVVSASIRECGEIGNLSFTGLIRGRDPGVDGGALSI
jgi:hypothetical protein